MTTSIYQPAETYQFEESFSDYDYDYNKLLLTEPPPFEDTGTYSETSSRLVKPPRNCTFRTRTGCGLYFGCNLLTVRDEFSSRLYLVTPEIAQMLPKLVHKVRLVPYMDSYGDIHFWPIKLERIPNILLLSVLDAAFKAQKRWVSLSWEKVSRTYTVRKVKTSHGDPVWPHEDEIYRLLKKNLSGVIMTQSQLSQLEVVS